MQAFKCALRIIRGNLVFLLVYIVGLSFMGVFMASSFDFEDIGTALNEKSITYAVVDRDNSELSQSLEVFLEDRGIPVQVEDSRIAFQDAVAKGQVDYLLVIPEHFEADFREAVLTGEDIPQMDVVYSFYALDGTLLDEAVSAYLSCVRTLVIADADASMPTIIDAARDAMSERTDVQIISAQGGMSEADRFVFYLRWSTYTLFAGIVVCVGLLITTMNRADVRRRNLASPMSYVSYNLQLALSCGVIALASAAWAFCLGLVFFPEAASSISAEGLTLCAVSVIAYAIMALAFGFMIGQFGISTLMCNALGNIVGMVISFLGGAWISLELLSPEIMALAHWLPGYWYTDACQAATYVDQSAFGDAATALSTVLADIGILALFIIAFLVVGFVAAKQRLQTSEAGGNRAAETTGMV